MKWLSCRSPLAKERDSTAALATLYFPLFPSRTATKVNVAFCFLETGDHSYSPLPAHLPLLAILPTYHLMLATGHRTLRPSAMRKGRSLENILGSIPLAAKFSYNETVILL